MNLSEMRKNYAQKLGVSQEKAKELIAAFEETVVDGLLADGKVVFGTLGSFEVVETKERTGVNPATGEKLIIPPSKRVKYKASKMLKETVKS